MRPHRGRVLLLAASSFVSGAVEAAFLVVITRAALAIADGDDDFGVLAGHSASLAAALGVAALLLGLRLALGLVGVRVSADLAVDVLTDARHRLADAYLHTSWAVQHREPSGRLQELLGGFAGLASGVVAAFGALMSSALTLLALIVVSFTINPIATLVVVVALVALGVGDLTTAPADPRPRQIGGRRPAVVRDNGLGARRAGHGDAGVRRPRSVRRSSARRRRG